MHRYSSTLMYLCLEDSQLLIQNRLFDVTEDTPANIHSYTESCILGNILTEQFHSDHPNTPLTIIDTLQMIRGATYNNTYANDYCMFISSVHKYIWARKFTPRMLDELVQYIEVHQAEKVNGTWVQRITIYYNCVGAITIPGALPLFLPPFVFEHRESEWRYRVCPEDQ